MEHTYSQHGHDDSESPCRGIPHRTKVVRLIVVHDEDDEAVRALAEKEGAAKPDVFIVGTHAKSFLNGRLVDHDAAIKRDEETAAFVIVSEREQLQWESEEIFEIVKIAKEKNPLKRVRCPRSTRRNVGTNPPPQADDDVWVLNDAAPDDPFPDLTVKAQNIGGPGNPIRSGLADPYFLDPKVKGQLYKVTFRIWVRGEAEPRLIDPDVYCDP